MLLICHSHFLLSSHPGYGHFPSAPHMASEETGKLMSLSELLALGDLNLHRHSGNSARLKKLCLECNLSQNG